MQVSKDVIETLGLPAQPRGADFAARVAGAKTRALWNLRARARERMVERLRGRGLEVGDSDALWIGCAGGSRGSAARLGLVGHDQARLERLLDDPVNAVRLAIVGPASDAETHAQLEALAQHPHLDGRLVYLSAGDPDSLKIVTQGVDLWLDGAAPGTEGGGEQAQGAAANGALLLSTLSGWWAAHADASAGWTLGGPRAFDDPAAQAEHDARAFYELMEREIVPLFYAWNREGISEGWVAKLRVSLSTLPAVDLAPAG